MKKASSSRPLRGTSPDAIFLPFIFLSLLMFLIKHDYRLGVFVEHNTKPRRAGFGSCIFLHIWSGPTEPTIGCTAMWTALKWKRSSNGCVVMRCQRWRNCREKSMRVCAGCGGCPS